jgi:hypothetical protein
MKTLLLAASIAALSTAAHAGITCNLNDTKGNSLTYSFGRGGDGFAPEISVTKNGTVVSNGGPTWTRVEDKAHQSSTLWQGNYNLAYPWDVSKAVSVMRYDNRIVAQGACVANPALDVGTTVAQGSAPVPVYTTTASFSVPLVIEDAGFKTTVGLGSSFYNMTVDTGATSGLLQESIANALLAKGEATELGGGTSTTADGRRLQDRRISVYSVTLNGHTIHDVMFGVGPDTGGMLFGLLPLAQFGRFTIDPARQQLTFS